jgi:hypothetical protein
MVISMGKESPRMVVYIFFMSLMASLQIVGWFGSVSDLYVFLIAMISVFAEVRDIHGLSWLANLALLVH